MRSAALALVLLAPAWAAAFTLPDAPSGHVNDWAHALGPETTAQLEALLRDEEARTSTQIVVVTLPSLDGKDIADVTAEIGKKWKIGQAKKDNGVIFAIAPSERRMRIEVGRGLEGAFTDLQTHVIQDEVVKPAFLAGKIEAGILAGTRAIVAAVHGEFAGQGQPQKTVSRHLTWQLAIPVVLLVLLFLFFPRAGMLFLLMATGRGGRGGGGFGSGGGGFSGGGGSFGGGGSSSSW